MSSICFYFQVHQPMRVKKYSLFNIGSDREYFNDNSGTNLDNKFIVDKVSNKCYLPANRLMLELLNKYQEFKISFSLSGVFIEQLENFAPKVLQSFKDLVGTGRVEILSETYYHSLSFLYSKEEFEHQVKKHSDKIFEVFGVKPTVFRNTELIYNNELANFIEEMGYKAILTEGADHILDGRSPNFVYRPKGAKKIKLLMKNYKLSDDIAFRFSSRDWAEHPLTVSKFSQWLNAVNGNGDVINLFMDYETFGEHQWEDTGIFDFLRELPAEVLKNPDNNFMTPSEVADFYDDFGEVDIHNFISWADVERDLSAWLSNPIQNDAIKKLYELQKPILASGDEKLIEDWRRLQTSDHFYYMCTKWFADGDVHKYFNPYESPYDAFISYMNVLQDLKLRLNSKGDTIYKH